MDNHVGKEGVRERAGREWGQIWNTWGTEGWGAKISRFFFSSDRFFVLFLYQRPPRFHKMSKEPKCVLLFNDADSHRPTAIQRKTSEIGEQTKRGLEEGTKARNFGGGGGGPAGGGPAEW